jgi:glycosyltransferase involved in cell wall biosynthesis
LAEIERTIDNHPQGKQIIRRIQYVPDEETELYFKAADVLALPYTHVFQSGVLFLAFNFGLPVIATDVGSIGEDIVEGRTGLVCKPRDPQDLASALEKYFASDLFKNLDIQRKEIKDYANARHSWDLVGEITRDVYLESLEVDG